MPSYKHHYIPAFLQKEWCGLDGQLEVFERPYFSKVVSKRKHPAQTGWVKELFAASGFPRETAQWMEDEFFKPIDTRASEALNQLKSLKAGSALPLKYRHSWISFLTSLQVRTPQDLTTLLSAFDERFKSQPKSNFVLDLLKEIIQSSQVVDSVNNMRFAVFDLRHAKHNLFLSDRPVHRTNGLLQEDGQIIMPISPKTLFVATTTDQEMTKIVDIGPNDIVAQCNERTVGNAKKFVYAVDGRGLRFVQKNFGIINEQSLSERVLEKLKLA